MRDRHSIRRIVAICSAGLIWLAAILQVLQSVGVTPGPKQPNFGNKNTRSLLRQLDTATLIQYWQYKAGQLKTDTSIDIFYSAGLFSLAYCVLILKRVFRRFKNGDSDIPGFMSGCFFFGALFPSIQLLQSLGTTTIADGISQWKNLPATGLQSLYISYNLQRGSGIYLFSSQFIFVSIGLILASYLSLKTDELPAKHAILGFITAFFGLLCFMTEVITFNVDGRGAAITFGICLLIYGVICLPVWILWLGIELKRLKQDRDAQKAEGMDLNLNDINATK